MPIVATNTEAAAVPVARSGSTRGKSIDPVAITVGGFVAVTLAILAAVALPRFWAGGSKQPPPEQNQRANTEPSDPTYGSSGQPGASPSTTPPSNDDRSAQPTSDSRKASGTAGGGPHRQSDPSFATLATAIAERKHLPQFDLDASNPAPREVALCTLFGAEVAVSLPREPFSTDGLESLACVVESPGRAWRFVAKRGTGPGEPVGGAAVKLGRLFVRLDAETPENALARQALAAGVLQIGNGRNPGETTHIQLRKPLALGPIVARRFFFDASLLPDAQDGQQGFSTLGRMPQSPWPCRADVTGSCGHSLGRVITVDPVARTARASGQRLVEWTLAWGSVADASEPFVETTLAFGADAGPLQLSLAAARLADAWSTPQRLGRFVAAPQAVAPGLLRDVADLAAEVTAGIPTGERVPASRMAAFAKAALLPYRSRVPQIVVMPMLFETPRFKGREQSTDAWAAELRQVLAESLSYRAWASAAAPGSAAAERAAAGAAAVRDFWDSIRANLAANAHDHEAIGICCLLEQLASLPEEKRKAVELVAGLGRGDAVFSGEIVNDFPSLGVQSVLVRFDPALPAVGHKTHVPLAAP